MAKFRYKMQNILDIKEQLENQAKMQFAAAQARLNEEENRLHLLQNRKEEYLLQGRQLRQNQISVIDLKENKNALARMDEYIKSQILQVRLAQKNLENARIKLQEVMIERKTHEKLKEKAFDDFLMDEKSTESKEIDELTSYTYGQKKDE